MISFVLWYLLITVVGLLSFPLAWRMLPNLADRGYALTRPLGLLVWGYAFWLLCTFHVLENNAGGILFALLILAALSFVAVFGRWSDLRDWLREHGRQVLASELVFLVAFAAWAVIRAMNPDITYTEKPMEQAFINAILRSPFFPPHDPWLSGYAISYYYFGYVMVAMLAKLTGTVSGVAFNLAVAMWFAMTALGAYGIVYSLVAKRFHNRTNANIVARFWALFAPFFVLLAGNLEGFLEMLHARGVFWQNGQSAFWSWLNIQELVTPPATPLTWIPNRPGGGWWWWRASRVLNDYTLSHDWREVIDEFPTFSYLLADLHPHVLAMPFVLLAIGLSLNFYLFARKRLLPEVGVGEWVRLWTQESPIPFCAGRLGTWLRTPGFWLAALILGALSFVNTWDFPIYVSLFSAAYVLARFQQDGWKTWKRLGEFIEIAASLAIAGVILFLPFYIGFSSQAGGFLPSLSFFTRGVYFWVMFGTLLVPIVLWLLSMWSQRANRSTLVSGLKFAAIAVFGLWILSYLLSALILGVLSIVQRFANLGALFLSVQGAQSGSTLLAGSFFARLSQPGMWITLLVLLLLIWGLISTFRHRPEAVSDVVSTESDLPEAAPTEEPEWLSPDPESSADAFVLLLLLLGAGLVLAPEFFYLRDQFGTRMNTIFKFYFETWMLWSLAAAYATIMIWNALRSGLRWVARAVAVAVLLMSLAYPIFGLWDKTNHFSTAGITLNGNQYFANASPDEMAAITWLRSAPEGVVAEAVGGSYTNFARVSELSGQPTVLGWPGHESQWRGGADLFASRQDDIATLYQSKDWNQTLAILTRYDVRYIYIGSLERSAYHINESKFQANLRPVFQNQGAVIYEVPPSSFLAAQPGG